MILNEHFRYRGYSTTELDEMIYFYETHKGSTVDLETGIISKPEMSAQAFARQALAILSETRTLVIQAIIGRDPDIYRHEVMIHLAKGMTEVYALCEKQLSAKPPTP